MNVCQRKIRIVPFQALQLGLEDVFTGRKPDHDLLRVVLDQLERNVALSGTGGMNNGSFAILVHHPDCRAICFFVVLKQTQCHPIHPFPHKGVSPIVIMEGHGKNLALFHYIYRFSAPHGHLMGKYPVHLPALSSQVGVHITLQGDVGVGVS